MIETDERLRALMGRIADEAPLAPSFEELGIRVNRTVDDHRRNRPLMMAAVGVVGIAAAGTLYGVSRSHSTRPPAGTPPITKAACELASSDHGMTDENIRTLIDYLLDVAPDSLTPGALAECKGVTTAELDRLRQVVAERQTMFTTP